MTDCPHEVTEPVEVRSHVSGATETVAHVCVACLDALPPNWGCPDCQLVDVRRLCDAVPTLIAGQPCDAHRRTA